MILQYIKLHNIRSYVNEKIDFPMGSLLLCGDIGSGKSTILLAIEFALFGLKRGDFTGASLLRNGENEGSVELKFSVSSGADSKNVVILRTLKRSSNSVKQDSGYISIDNHKTEGTPIELKSMILNILGYPDSLLTKSKDMIYRYTVYTPQEDMKSIIFADKEERLDTLRRVFNIDRYKRVRENIQVVSRYIRERIKNYEGMIYSLPDKSKEYKSIIKEANEIAADVKELIPIIKEITDDIQSTKSEIESANEVFMEFKNIQKSLEFYESEYSSLTQERKSLNLELANIEKQVNSLDEKIKKLDIGEIDESMVERLGIDVESSSKNLNDKKSHNVLIKENIRNLKENISILTEETKSKKALDKLIIEKFQELKNIEVVVRQKDEISKNIEKVEKIILKLRNDITESGVKYASAEKVVSDVAELSDCPTCHQKVTDKYKKEIISDQKQLMKKIKGAKDELEDSLKGYEDRLARSKENYNNIISKEKELEKLKAELEAQHNNVKEFDSKKLRLEELSKKQAYLESQLIPDEDIKKLESQISEKKKQLKEHTDKLSRFKEKKAIEESLSDKKNLRSDRIEKSKALDDRISSIEIKIKDSKKKLEELNYINDEIKKLNLKLSKLQDDEKELSTKKTSSISKRETLVRTKNILEKEIIKMREVKEKMSYLNEYKIWLTEYFSKMTSIMEKNVMMKVFNEFNSLFREWFSILIDDEMLNVRLNEEFTPVIEQNGYDIEVSDLSGGEKTSCALAYRLALNKVINDCINTINTKDIIILDEPTDGFSTEQLDRLRDVLDIINIKQVIIVSHEPKIESFVDNIIKVNKSEHISSVI